MACGACGGNKTPIQVQRRVTAIAPVRKLAVALKVNRKLITRTITTKPVNTVDKHRG